MSVEIGSYLRQAREAIGLSLDQVQEKTKIQKSFLIAIENGEFDKLPSPFYVRTYLRSYANCVKVEPHHILRQYRKIEQAERFTGVHKAVTGNDLSQTPMRPPLQKTGRMPAVSPGTGPQKKVSLENTIRMQPLKKGSQRINTQTALTAPKSESGQLNDRMRRDRELARRDVGYMRSNTSIMRAVPPRQDTQPNENVTAAASTMEHKEHPKELYPTVESRRTRELKQSTQKLGAVQSQGTKKLNALSQTGPAGGTLSLASKPKREMNQVSLPPADPKELEMDPVSLSEQRVTQFQSLSRSAVKNRKAAKKQAFKFPIKRSVTIAIVGLVLCIPLAWAVVSFTGKSDKTAGTPKTVLSAPADQGNNGSSNKLNSQTTANAGQLKYVVTGNNVVHYHLSGTNQAVIQVKAVGGRCRIVLTNDLPGSANTQSIVDVTLEKGHAWKYTYTFNNNPDLYIGLQQSQNVVVTVNGQAVNTSRYVHIKKVDGGQ